MKNNKVSSLILTLTASAVLVSVPAVAQIGGALGSTLGGRGQAQANRGGLTGGLGLDHTLNGSAQRGGSGLGLGTDSTLNGTLDASGTGDRVGETAAKAKGKVKNTADTTVDTTKGAATRVKGKADGAKDNATNLLQSTSVTSSTETSSDAKASSSKGDKSASGSLGLLNSTDANAGGKHVSADSNANGKASADSNASVPKPGLLGSTSSASAENSNAGAAKLHGLNRAESRVDNQNALSAMQHTKPVQVSATGESKSSANSKVGHKK
ncbi:MAG: hypothetical protein JWO13_1337 [Acidobacteriales bacterium]|nr:hypothetical protein [Terriglobales bacterium]